jgi:hypothetical protein
MNSTRFPIMVISGSLLVSLFTYIVFSRREKSYINILTPYLMVGIPALYLFPLIYLNSFGVETSTYSYFWVFATLAVETLAFAYAYIKSGAKVVRLWGLSSYSNFRLGAFLCLITGVLLYVPVLIQFREFIFDPRQIYMQTRTGFGFQAFVSSTLAYIGVILILFSKCSKMAKILTIVLATVLLSLHGSKGQILALAFILLLHHVYVQQRKITLARAAIVGVGVGTVALILFAVTMSLGEGTAETLETISEYSDYNRNAMLVVDSHYPLQYGRLTIESNTLALVPRQLMPGKPKNFGPFALAEEFFPKLFDADMGSPAFGVGLQYADFGAWAIVYVALAAAFRGWLARVFVNRLRLTNHPADFFMVVFLADIPIFPVGIGWLLPEALGVALCLRFFSRMGAKKTFRESRKKAIFVPPVMLGRAESERGD